MSKLTLDKSQESFQESNTANLSTKEKIIKVTTKLVSENSFSALRLSDVAEKVLIPVKGKNNEGKYKPIQKATIFHHFNSKSGLGYEILRFRHEQLEKAKKLQLEKQFDPWTRLEKFIYGFLYANVKGICPGVAMSVEINLLSELEKKSKVDSSDDIKQKLMTMYEFNIEWMAEILEEGRNLGEFFFKESSNDKARFIWASMHGGWIASRVSDNLGIFERIKEQIIEDLK